MRTLKKLTALLLAALTLCSLLVVNVSAASFDPIWPCQNARYISTYYRYWNGGSPSQHGTRSNYHNAIDIAGSSGDAIYAVESGTVTETGYQKYGFGHYVVVEHSNGLRSLYGHLKYSPAVSKGQRVSRGQVVGYMGSTGDSSGNHLHFELYNPQNTSQVTDPFMTYYKGKVSVTIGSNSYRANSGYTGSDSYARAWCSFLSGCPKNSGGDYVSNANSGGGTGSNPGSFTTNFRLCSATYCSAYTGINSGYCGRVWPGDVVTVQEVFSNGWMRISCPWSNWSGGYRTVYVKITDFSFKCTKYINALDSAGGSKIGRAYPNDVCPLEAITSNGYIRCRCPWTGGVMKTIWLCASEIYG